MAPPQAQRQSTSNRCGSLPSLLSFWSSFQVTHAIATVLRRHFYAWYCKNAMQHVQEDIKPGVWIAADSTARHPRVAAGHGGSAKVGRDPFVDLYSSFAPSWMLVASSFSIFKLTLCIAAHADLA